jgi:hypothetical protein
MGYIESNKNLRTLVNLTPITAAELRRSLARRPTMFAKLKWLDWLPPMAQHPNNWNLTPIVPIVWASDTRKQQNFEFMYHKNG